MADLTKAMIVAKVLRAAVGAALALIVIDLGSRLVARAAERAENKGRFLGQCDVIVILDKHMSKTDPKWINPAPELVKACRAALDAAHTQSEGE